MNVQRYGRHPRTVRKARVPLLTTETHCSHARPRATPTVVLLQEGQPTPSRDVGAAQLSSKRRVGRKVR